MKKFFLLIIFSLLWLSCARVGSPVGGSKDTIPPKFLGANIDTSRVNIPVDTKELRLYFDEYVVLKDVQKNLIISPPIKVKKILPTNLGNKYILIEWEEPLAENTTYSFNFGNAITDLNEGNVLPYYNFAFSTGEKLDNLYISGEVKDGLSLETPSTSSNNKKNYVVGLYQEKDTINYAKKPYYITKVDDDGYFELNYLSKGQYRILAFDDSNQNSIYDAGKENVAFRQEAITVENNISGMPFSLFPSKKNIKLVETKEATGGILMLFEGNPQKVEVTPVDDKIKNYRVTHRPHSDSVNIWFDAKQENIGITQSENIKLKYQADEKQGEASIFYRLNPKNELTLSNQMGNAIPPNKNLELTANYPIDTLETNQWSLKSDSTTTVSFTAKISEKTPSKVLITAPFEIGKKYSLTVPKETLSSFYTTLAKTHQFNFEIDKEENYGSFALTIEAKPEAPFWIQFLDDKGDVKLSKYTQEAVHHFKTIKPGKYQLRILVDDNSNGIWDASDLATLTFAERVHLFPKSIEIRPLWENKESWHLGTNSTETPPLKSNNE